MRAFILACAMAVIVAFIGYAVLNAYQEPSSEAYSTSAVRLDA